MFAGVVGKRRAARCRRAGISLLVGGAACWWVTLFGCAVAGSVAGGATQVLYIITNRTSGAVTFMLESNGNTEESVSIAADGTKVVLDDCEQVDEFRMSLVCGEGGADCNNLGILIEPGEVRCGDAIDVYIDSAVDGQLQLSAFRRNSDGTPGGGGDSGESSNESNDTNTSGGT